MCSSHPCAVGAVPLKLSPQHTMVPLTIYLHLQVGHEGPDLLAGDMHQMSRLMFRGCPRPWEGDQACVLGLTLCSRAQPASPLPVYLSTPAALNGPSWPTLQCRVSGSRKKGDRQAWQAPHLLETGAYKSYTADVPAYS